MRKFTRTLLPIAMMAAFAMFHVEVHAGLVAHYAFDGNAQDSSANHFHGSATSAVHYTADRFGNDDSAAYFTHQRDARVSLGNRSQFNAMGNLFTIAYWAYVPSEGGGGMIADHDIIGTRSDDWFFGLGYSTWEERQGLPWFSFGNSRVDANTAVGLDAWHHVAMRRSKDSGVLEFFIDGQLDHTVTGRHNNLTAGTSLNLGPYDTPGGWASNGYIGGLDELMFYNAWLSDEQIAALAEPTHMVPGPLAVFAALPVVGAMLWRGKY